MKAVKRQRGFLLIAAITLIVIVGFYGVVFTHIISSGADANAGYIQAVQSYYVAEAGLNKGLFGVNSPTVEKTITSTDARTGCTTISDTSFGAGQYNVSTATLNTSQTILQTGISASDTSITVGNTSGFSTGGMLYIGNEKISYTGIGTCNNGPCITGLTRGAENTLAQSHDSGTYVSELACSLTANGGVPSIASANGSTTLNAQANMETGFAVGLSAGSNVAIYRWNLPTSNTWTDVGIAGIKNNLHLNAVSAAGPDYAWAVGDDKDDKFALYSWNAGANPATWQLDASPPTSNDKYIKDLDGVSAVSPKEVWAVGQRSGKVNKAYRYSILRYSGGSWCKLEPSSSCGGKTIPADEKNKNDIAELRAVSVIDTSGDGFGNIGFAVGDDGVILKYDGTDWTKVTSPTSNDLLGVQVISANEAWAVGYKGTILHWVRGTWSTLSGTGTGNNDILEAVTAVDTNSDSYADAGWVVGRNGTGARAYRFTQSVSNGNEPVVTTSWTTHQPSGLANQAMYCVAMLRQGDVWAGSRNGNIMHWNGTDWAQAAKPHNKHIKGIALVGPINTKASTFHETFN
ncbi:MAG: hypothetical protein P1U63_01625 [Coxiellaceae bacterium]|nr:hypothetical protein [Coxiellaceae bacterium]